MTWQQLINQSLIQLGVIASGESPSSDESADALTALERLIGSWNEILKINLAGAYASLVYTFVPIAAPGALGDTINTSNHPLSWQRALIFNLCEEIASQYGKSVSPEIAAKALASRNAVMTIPPPAA